MNLNQSNHVTQHNGEIYSQVLEKKPKTTQPSKTDFQEETPNGFSQAISYLLPSAMCVITSTWAKAQNYSRGKTAPFPLYFLRIIIIRKTFC